MSDNEAKLKDQIRYCKSTCILTDFENKLEIKVVSNNITCAELSQNPSERNSFMPLIAEMNASICIYTDLKKKMCLN